MRYLRTGGPAAIRRPGPPTPTSSSPPSGAVGTCTTRGWSRRPPEEYDSYLRKIRRRDNAGYLICDRASGAIAGYVNISGIVLGALRGGYLGYAAFQPYSGTGHASAGVALVIDHAFTTAGLHRLEANIQPGNEPSRRVARKLGFRLEGFSPDYLFIDGAWRDHERWAITASTSA
ncbi:GNAT family protein [Micromonospora sp. M12]